MIEFPPFCFLISGGLNIVFGLNTDMIRPQTLQAEKPTQPTRGESVACRYKIKIALTASPGVPGSSCHVSPPSHTGLLWRLLTLILERQPLEEESSEDSKVTES